MALSVVSNSLPYSMQLSRAAEKKINACNRQSPVDIVRDEGGIRIFLQAGAYEAMKYALRRLYEEYPNPDVTI